MGLFHASLPKMEEHHHREVDASIKGLAASVHLFEQVKGRRAYQLLLIALLNLADVVTTTIFLEMGVSEGNPLLMPIVHMWWAPLIVKGVIFVAVMTMVSRCPIRSRTASVLLRMAVSYYTFVVCWNLWVIYHH